MVEKQCPYRAACKQSWFCLHSLKCLICDAHSCDQCQLYRGDAELVIEIANRLKPRRIALDFDRTVSSTRTGGKPIIGTHTADVDLMSLMWNHPCVIVTRNQHQEDIRLFLIAQGAPPDIQILTVKKKESKAAYVIGNLQDTQLSEAQGMADAPEESSQHGKKWKKNSSSSSSSSSSNSSSSSRYSRGSEYCYSSDDSEADRTEAVLFVDDSVQELVDNTLVNRSDSAQLHRILFVRGLV